MECNKEEAIRAKEIAEKKMQNNDFFGAQRIGLKAKQLFPELENISHLLAVCDVHCSSQNKSYGSDLDWYGILQVERIADEATIRKQYRKLALLLHPDKNKLAGAEAAFKLIAQANTVLSDQGKRSLYDTKVRVSVGTTLPKVPPHQENRDAHVRKPKSRSFDKAQFMSSNGHQQASSFGNGQATFCTRCDTCGSKYHYGIDVMNRRLHCIRCSHVFTASDLGPQGVPPTFRYSQHASFYPKDVPTRYSGTNSQSSFCKTPSDEGAQAAFSSKTAGSEPVLKTGRTAGASSGSTGKRGSNESVDPGGFGIKTARTESVLKTGSTADVGSCFKSKVRNDVNMNDQKEDFGVPKPDAEKWKQPGASRSMDRKRRREMVAESNERCGAASIDDLDGESVIQENGGGCNSGNNGAYHHRRSSRRKCSVSYNETEDDNDFVNPPTVSEAGAPPNACDQEMQKEGDFSAMVDENKEGINENESIPPGENTGTTKSEAAEYGVKREAQKVVCPDPQFCDFEKAEKCYAVDQIWAIYDWIDGMPRFYARIKKVYSRGFRLEITWLEPHPLDQDEIDWVDVDLPVACGRYKLRNSQVTSDKDMFSHQVKFQKGNGRGLYMIYPRKGDTWALFKNWDMRWSSERENHKEFELEVVEVLEDFVEGAGVTVAYLDKVKGFVSLFRQTTRGGVSSFKISPHEHFRFSHQIPSFRLSGRKIEGVPEGSFELDPAALHSNFTEADQGISLPKKDCVEQDIDIRSQDETYKESSSNCIAGDQSNEYMNGVKDKNHLKAAECDLNETFHSCSAGEETRVHNCNTSCSRSLKKTNIHSSLASFDEMSQVRYHNFDEGRSKDKFGLHQVWAVYSDLDGLPKAYVHIRRLETNPEFKLVVAMLDACPVMKDEIVPVSCGLFKPGRKQTFAPTSFSHELKVDLQIKKFKIYPRKGEVWALYKDWSPKWTPSDVKNSLYDIVEIIEGNSDSTKVLFLESVNGLKAVFMAPGEHRYMEINSGEFPRFSHQIPAVTWKMNDFVGASWELDPASVPGTSSC